MKPLRASLGFLCLCDGLVQSAEPRFLARVVHHPPARHNQDGYKARWTSKWTKIKSTLPLPVALVHVWTRLTDALRKQSSCIFECSRCLRISSAGSLRGRHQLKFSLQAEPQWTIACERYPMFRISSSVSCAHLTTVSTHICASLAIAHSVDGNSS